MQNENAPTAIENKSTNKPSPSEVKTNNKQQKKDVINNSNCASFHQHTMNFLYQAANFMAHQGIRNISDNQKTSDYTTTISDTSTTKDIQVSKHYSSNMKKIAKKNVLRL